MIAGDIERYLETGEHDALFSSWPGNNLLECARAGSFALRDELEEEIRIREASAQRSPQLAELDLVSLTRAKVAPMVRGLFPRVEQAVVLALLERSIVFLTPANIRSIIRTGTWLGTVWKLADAYLADIGAERLSTDGALLGLSEGTTCYVATASFDQPEPFSDYIVHEAAHVFHNCERTTVGLPTTRNREWLLSIDYSKRETFAYACEAFGYLLAHADARADRIRLLDELAHTHLPSDLKPRPTPHRRASSAPLTLVEESHRCSIQEVVLRPIYGPAAYQ